jgi:replicative DNA helicase
LSIDLTTLALLKYRDRYDKLARSVPKRALDARTAIILDDFGAFFREFPDVQKIESGPFALWFKAFRHPTLKAEAVAVFDQLFPRFDPDVSADLESGLMARLVAANTAIELADMLAKFSEGEEMDFGSLLRTTVDAYESSVDRKVRNPQVLTPIEDLLKAEENDTGFHWRLHCMNANIKALRGGDFVVIAARPDKGKTTFAADQLTFMAAQVDALYPGEKRSILWLNNEGPGGKIVLRTFQAALGITVEEMAKLSNAGTVRDAYRTAVGGRAGVLRIFDIHGMSNVEVEDLIAKHKPAMVVFDMIDNIQFHGLANNGGQRTDQLLEAMYQWARMQAVKHDFVAMAMSQISAEGDGLQFPTLPMLKDSKTGKQGAADLIVTIGSLNDPMMEKSRWIGVTKSKKVRTGMSKSPNAEVIFDGDRARFVESPN